MTSIYLRTPEIWNKYFVEFLRQIRIFSERSVQTLLKMYAIDIYTSTCRYVMQADPDNPATLGELRRLLPCLRQALGCYVCFNLLKDPMGPNHNVCRHLVCLNCLGGKMKLKPACSWCKDHFQFVPNPILKILITCFKKLCMYIYSSHLGEVIKTCGVNGETNHLLKLVQEGIDFQDDYVPPTLNTHTNSSPSTVNECSQAPPALNLPATTTHVSPEVNIKDESLDAHNKTSNERNIESSNLPSVHLNDIKLNNNRKRKTENVTDHNYENKVHSVIRNKNSKKPVIFLKRATVNKNKCKSVSLKTALNKVRKGKRKQVVVKKFNTRSKHEAPSDLERIDNCTTSLRKVKVELQPPELKPLSSCNCGKAGNYNQLTCIGQRCPCYSMKLPCVGCKCRGCRNPKKGPDYQGINTIGSSAVLRSGTRNATESYT